MHTPPACQTSRRQILRQSLATVVVAAVPGVARASYMVRSWPESKPAPVLELSDMSGKAWTLAALKGQPVILNFWASWCEPCRAEMPSLELLATRHQPAGLVVLTVNYKEAAPAIKRFLDLNPFSLPILLDRDGAATTAWTPRVFPTTVLIDRNGAPRHSVLGDLDWMGKAARDLLEPLLLARPRTT